MNRSDRANSQYWRSCCAGCLIELALMTFGVASGVVLTAIIEPSSALASLLAALLFPATYVIGSIVWSFIVFVLMGWDAFRKSVSTNEGAQARWLPESTTARPGAVMYIPAGIGCALLASIIVRVEGHPATYQTLCGMYLVLSVLFGTLLWVLGRNKIVGPLSPLLQWLIESF